MTFDSATPIPSRKRLRDLLAVLDAASKDPAISHALLLTDDLAGAGLPTLRELSAALQVAVVHLPFLNLAFGTVPLAGAQWLVCVAMASGVLWFSEGRKLLRRP